MLLLLTTVVFGAAMARDRASGTTAEGPAAAPRNALAVLMRRTERPPRRDRVGELAFRPLGSHFGGPEDVSVAPVPAADPVPAEAPAPAGLGWPAAGGIRGGAPAPASAPVDAAALIARLRIDLRMARWCCRGWCDRTGRRLSARFRQLSRAGTERLQGFAERISTIAPSARLSAGEKDRDSF